MKKIYTLIIVLVLLSATVFCGVSATVNAERDQVNITEKVLYGDRTVAEGLEITTKNHLKYQLFWESDYTIGKTNSVKTKYSLHPTKHLEISRDHVYEGISINTGIDFGFNEERPLAEQKGIQKAYKLLFDSTKNGEEKTKTVYLKDYYDYYPLGIGFDLPYTDWIGYEYTNEQLKGKPYDSLYVTEKFREYFKIPVGETDSIKISVTKDVDGDLFGTGTEDINTYNLYTISTVSRKRNRCFFTINNYISENQYADTSLIPGGYGIYSFYYFGGDSAYNTGIMADKLETVIPLDTKTTVRHISLNKDETKLLLFTVENGTSCLEAIDIETLKTVQKFPIGSNCIDFVYEYDDFIVIDMSSTISVVSVKGDSYNFEFNVQKASFTNEKFQDIWNTDCMDFKNGKLAMIGNAFDEENGYELCDFFVSIYDKGGLIYYGVYDNALDINRLDSQYEANCHPNDTKPNKIEWN